MRILVVEDDRRSREFLVKGLRENNFLADTAADGEDGLFMASENEYDLIILDVMLPVFDGWRVLERLRARNQQTPVLFLTARDAVTDRVKGLELGADDYLVKPFAWTELLARVRSILRRGPARQPDVFVIGDLEIDVPRMKARRGGKTIDLTAKEFQLLCLLARRQGEVLSRTLIAEKVWDMNFFHGLQCGGRGDGPAAAQDGRAFREKAHPYPARTRLRAGGAGWPLTGSAGR